MSQEKQTIPDDPKTKKGDAPAASQEPSTPGSSAGMQERIAQLETELADLRENQSLIEHAVDIADLGYGLWDDHLARETVASEVMARIHGMSLDEYLNTVTSLEVYVNTLIIPEDRAKYLDYENSIDINQGDRTRSLDFRIRTPQGNIKYLRQTSRFLAESGTPPTQSVVAMQDITEIKQMEEVLQESRARAAASEEFRSITAKIARLGHAVWDYEKEQYRYVSEEWADIFGYSAEEFLTQFLDFESDMALVHPADRDRYLTYYHNENDESIIEYRILRRDGEVRHVEQHYHYDEAQDPSTSLVTLQDVTARKMAEINLIHSSKLVTLGEMSTSLAHELNQPLNAISLAAENVMLQGELGHTDLPAVVLEKIQRIKEQVKRAASIIDHMRMFGREASEGNSRFDCRDSISGCMKIYGEQLRLSQIDIQLAVSSEPLIIEGHPIRLEQVLINLMSNALHAMKSQESTDGHYLRIGAEKNELGQAVIQVSDTGGGIPEDVLNRIFEPFFTTKPMNEGTGLGLSVSFGIIGEMKGELVAENTARGTCFTITIPLAQRRKLKP